LEFDAKTVFRHVAAQMRSEFEQSRSAMSHPGLKGANAENIVRDFFRQHLPKRIGIGTGVAVDCHGAASRQLDIVFYDSLRTPILFSNGDTQVFPVESILAVMEVKSTLTMKELDSMFKNMLSVKSLQKSAYYVPGGAIERVYYLYDSELAVWPMCYFFFAFDADNPTAIAEQIRSENKRRNLSVERRIDSGCVLSGHVFLNSSVGDKSGIDALPTSSSFFHGVPSEHPLLLFYTLIAHYLVQAEAPQVRFKDYLGNMQF
jgi:hypothetical protein